MLENYFGAWNLGEVERLTQLRQQLSVWDAQHIANELNAFMDAGQKTGVANDTVALVSEKERFMALCSLLRVLSSQRPLVVVIEDAQWGTAALEWFRFAMSEFPDLRVMWLITWRTGTTGVTPDSPIGRTLMNDAGRVKSIALQSLTAQDCRSLISARLSLDDDALTQLAALADGNPLFAELLVEHWIENSSSEGTEGGFRLRNAAQAEVPDSIHDLWQDRLEAAGLLDQRERQWSIELAAVLGNQFERKTWIDCCTEAGIKFDRSVLATLEQRGLLERQKDGRFHFVHALLPETLSRLAQEGVRLTRWHDVCATTLSRKQLKPWYRIALHQAASENFEAAADSMTHAVDHRRTIGDLQGLAEGVKHVARFLRQAGIKRHDEQWVIVRIRWSYVNRMSGRQKAALRHARRARRMLTLDEQLGLYAQATLQRGLQSNSFLTTELPCPSLKTLWLQPFDATISSDRA